MADCSKRVGWNVKDPNNDPARLPRIHRAHRPQRSSASRITRPRKGRRVTLRSATSSRRACRQARPIRRTAAARTLRHSGFAVRYSVGRSLQKTHAAHLLEDNEKLLNFLSTRAVPPEFAEEADVTCNTRWSRTASSSLTRFSLSMMLLCQHTRRQRGHSGLQFVLTADNIAITTHPIFATSTS